MTGFNSKRAQRRTFLAGIGASTLLGRRSWAASAVQIADPPAGKAQIVFYRRWQYADAAISYIVREGSVELGLLSAGSYFVTVVDPGLHTYTVHAERKDQMQIVAEPDETYYVRFELDIGVVLYQPSLTPSEQRLFDEISGKLKLSDPLPPKAQG